MVAPVDILAYAMTPSNGEDTIASERLFEGDDTFCILRRFVQHSWRLALQRGTALLALGSRGAGGAPSWAVFPMRLVSASGARLLCVTQREPSSRPSWRLTSVVAESSEPVAAPQQRPRAKQPACALRDGIRYCTGGASLPQRAARRL